MNVLIISDAWHPQINGVVRTYEYLGEELEKKGHTVKVIGPSDFPMRIPMPGYSEIKLAIAPYNRLKRMIGDFSPDRIHIATEGPLGWAARRYCLSHKRTFSTSYHTQFPDYVAKRAAKLLPFLYKPARELGKRFVRTFHAPSKCMMIATQSLEEELLEWGFETPIRRLSRGVKLDQFYPGEKTLFRDLPGPIAIYVGRVAIEKNLEAFLDMDWPGSKVVVGDGPSLPALQKQYPQAHFIGKREGAALAEAYRSADLFVFPSKTDTFGIVLIEALASGLPVAAFDVTGPRDIITEPYLGVLSADNLAEAAGQALKDGKPDLCAAHVRQHYTWENAGRQFEEALLAESA